MLHLTLIYYLELHSFLWPFSSLLCVLCHVLHEARSSLCSLQCCRHFCDGCLSVPASLLRSDPSRFIFSYSLLVSFPSSYILVEFFVCRGDGILWLLFLFFKCSKMFGHNFTLFGGNIFSGKCSPFVRKFWCAFASFILRVTLHWFSTCSSFP